MAVPENICIRWLGVAMTRSDSKARPRRDVGTADTGGPLAAIVRLLQRVEA